MKTLVKISATTLILIGLFTANIFAQGINIRQINERTNSGLTSGLNANYTIANGMQMGVFYAENVDRFTLDPEQCVYNERNFTGVFYSFPITRMDKFNLHFQSRFGVSNGKRVTYAPALVGSINLTPNLAIEAGISNRLFSYGTVVGISYQFGKPIKLRNVARPVATRYY